jgi:hypothetical protein
MWYVKKSNREEEFEVLTAVEDSEMYYTETIVNALILLLCRPQFNLVLASR